VLRRSDLVLVAPAIVLLAGFYLLPNFLNLGLGFTDWSVYREGIRFNGLENFQRLVNTDTLGNAVGTTLVFAVVVMVVQNILGVGLALALERPTRLNGILRTIFFIPVLISPLAAGYVFRGLLAPEGTLNAALSTLMGAPVTIAWLGSREFTLIVLALIQVWKGVGFTMLIYLAGLAAVPTELEEAARVDGARGRQVVTKIKLPLLAPAMTANLVLTLIGSIGTFDIVLATTRGGPGRATTVLNMTLYQQFANGLFGLATAINLVVFVLIVIASVPLIVYLRRREVQL
ncbi:MAG: sugar ABC transporter permease, partial [Candidatus Dormibacteraeota bacterium]|nr:sugar ABC transporter permease [Candidatus Dormibacteraeota bacterium]